MPDTFVFQGLELPLFDHEYNTTILNERAIEIPIVMSWLDRHGHGIGLEVGNVLDHYFPEILNDRAVVDRYEEGEHIDAIDVFDVRNPNYNYIFSISTIEHVRWDPPEERQLNGAANAIEHLYGLLANDGKMLISVPFGSNPGLDYAILAGYGARPIRQTVMMRSGGLWHLTPGGRQESKGSSWYEADGIWWERYGKSTPWADAVWFGEYEK